MLHLFQTPRTIAVLPCSSFDMVRYFTRKRRIRCHLLCACGRRMSPHARTRLDLTPASVRMRPTNELTHQIGKIWPENPRKTDDGGESFLGKRRLRKADRARRMLGAVPALNRAPIAPLPAWPEIKTWTLVADAPARWRRKL